MIGASIAVTISKIPFNGPISGVSVGMVDGQFVINPTAEQQKKSRMAVTVASTDKKVAMIEAGADQVTDEEMFDAIMFGHKANQQVIEFIKKIREEVGVPKMEFPSNDPSHEMYEDVEAIASTRFALPSTPTTSASATRLCSPFMPRFTKNSTKNIPRKSKA